MITAKELYHTCEGAYAPLAVEMKWERGVWVQGIKVITKCPYCKETLPEMKQINQVGLETFYWRPNHMSSELIPYDGIVLSIKEPKKRAKRLKGV